MPVDVSPNFPRLVQDVFIAVGYGPGVEHLHVYDCPIPTPAGATDYGRMWIAVAAGTVERYGMTPAVPGTIYPGEPRGPHLGLSTTSPADALDQAAAHLDQAAAHLARRHAPEETP